MGGAFNFGGSRSFACGGLLTVFCLLVWFLIFSAWPLNLHVSPIEGPIGISKQGVETSTVIVPKGKPYSIPHRCEFRVDPSYSKQSKDGGAVYIYIDGQRRGQTQGTIRSVPPAARTFKLQNIEAYAVLVRYKCGVPFVFEILELFK